MMKDAKPDLFAARANRVAILSDRLLGVPDEMDAAEAEELLRAADIDPQGLKARLFQRFDGLARRYAAEDRRVPPLLKQALADLRPGVSSSRGERESVREAQAAIRTFLKQAKQLPELLANLPNLTFAAAYRNRKELSEHDKELLDETAEYLQRRGKDAKRG